MPVGVPKIPVVIDILDVKTPDIKPETEKKNNNKETTENQETEKEKETEVEWIDLFDHFNLHRMIFLGAEIDTELANRVMGLMIYLSLMNPTKDLVLYINSPGGSVMDGLGIYGTIQSVPPDVHTICFGQAASMASLILLGGTTAKRSASPHSRILIRKPKKLFVDGKHLLLDEAEVNRICEDIVDIYINRTGKPESVLRKVLDTNHYMSATEAKDHGIIDFISEKFETRFE